MGNSDQKYIDKPYGFECIVTPSTVLDKSDEKFQIDKAEINIKGNLIKVGYDKPEYQSEAEKIITNLLRNWMIRTGVNIEYEFNRYWKPNQKLGRHYNLNLTEQITLTDRVTTTTRQILAMAYVIKQNDDSWNLHNDIKLTNKTLQNETAALILRYYTEDILSGKNPLPGIHKCIEQITKELGNGIDGVGRDKLSILAQVNRSYIDDLMTSVQFNRHSQLWLVQKRLNKILDDNECINRAKLLVNAYFRSL